MMGFSPKIRNNSVGLEEGRDPTCGVPGTTYRGPDHAGSRNALRVVVTPGCGYAPQRRLRCSHERVDDTIEEWRPRK